MATATVEEVFGIIQGLAPSPITLIPALPLNSSEEFSPYSGPKNISYQYI